MTSVSLGNVSADFGARPTAQRGPAVRSGAADTPFSCAFGEAASACGQMSDHQAVNALGPEGAGNGAATNGEHDAAASLPSGEAILPDKVSVGPDPASNLSLTVAGGAGASAFVQGNQVKQNAPAGGWARLAAGDTLAGLVMSPGAHPVADAASGASVNTGAPGSLSETEVFAQPGLKSPGASRAAVHDERSSQLSWSKTETHLAGSTAHTMLSGRLDAMRLDNVEAAGAQISEASATAFAAAAQTDKPSVSDATPRPLVTQIADQLLGAIQPQGEGPAEVAETWSPQAPSPLIQRDAVKALHFQLNPGQLGEVHVRLVMRQSEVQVSLNFSAENTANIARADGQALVKALIDGGMAVSQIVIESSAGSGAGSSSANNAGSAGAQAGGGTGGGSAHRERQVREKAEPPMRSALAERLEPEIRRSGLFV